MRSRLSSGGTVALLLESDGPGGAEQMILQLAEELRARGHPICPVGPASGCGWLAEQFRRRGFKPEVFRLRRPIDGQCVTDLVKVFRRRHVAVAHSHEFTMALYGAAAAWILRRPHVITMHGSGYFTGAWRRRVALRWAAKGSHATITVSRALRAQLAAALRLTPTAFRVIHNGVSVRCGSPHAVRRELAIGPHEALVVAIGNLYPVKGHMVLLRAMGALKGRSGLPRWHVAIAGRGEEDVALRSYAAAHGLSERLHLLGYRDDVVDLLASADVFALPSLSEGIPLALLEAMFAGTGIVASAVGGVPEVVTAGQEALLVRPGDPDSLAASLAQLLQDGRYRRSLGAAARERAQREFSLGAMVDRYEAVYESALRASHSGSAFDKFVQLLTSSFDGGS